MTTFHSCLWRGLLGSLAAILLLGMAAPSSAQPSAASGVDFDAALRGLKFKPEKVDGNQGAKGKANGLLDADEMALAAAILNGPDRPFEPKGGLDRAKLVAAYDQAMISAQTDLARLTKTWPTAPQVAAGYALLGEDSYLAFNAMAGAFGAPMKGDYTLARALTPYLAADGDADGDGVSNRDEYAATIKDGRAAYIRAALDPAIKPAKAAAVAAPVAEATRTLGVVLYPGFEVLDVFGPVEMWANTPGLEVVMISQDGGPVRSAQGTVVHADYSFATAPRLAIMMVPGGAGTYSQLENPALLSFLNVRDAETEFTASVCTGSAILAKAGLLKGRKATSNKAFFSLAVEQDPTVNWIKRARWVEDGKYFTSSGVSAGTDMALGLIARLKGKAEAHALAKSLEYEWRDDPSYDPFAKP
ncbi:DJ-1/PfpI family protein [Caulobacter vibrioides]|uniref:DJ-1/PfpI family protein n=1 Tax=Caulobacter vibrioides TaxID=155892 RepID=A0A290MJK4_CAUVI|nr:DJ-1/PfpI family protein [Caulobacter vibrioides]ATC32188.1 DJ-1/PfpI family protein [Caulobacter vibrioides]